MHLNVVNFVITADHDFKKQKKKIMNRYSFPFCIMLLKEPVLIFSDFDVKRKFIFLS